MERWSAPRGVLVPLVIVLGLAAVASVARADALDEYNLAVQLYRQSRWNLAAESFQKFLKDHPGHERRPFAQLYLGLTLVNQADYKAARDVLRTFVKESPKNQNLPQAKYRIAECSYLLNDFPAARTELEAYLKDHADDQFADRAWPYLGDVQLRLNNAPAAVTAFRTAVEKFPKGPLIDDALFGWAKALEAQQQFDAAIAKYQELAKAGGNRAAEALLQVGARQFDGGKYAEAAQTYQQLCTRFAESPFVPDARLNAGMALFRTGQFSEAAKQFQTLANDETRGIQAGYWRGLCLKNEGDVAGAEKVLAELATRAGQHPLADAISYQQGVCLRMSDRAEEAVQIWTALLQRSPQGEYSDDALYSTAELALEADDLMAVDARLKQFATTFPKSGLKQHCELLQGRADLARAAKLAAAEAKPLYTAAADRFQQVLGSSTTPRVRGQARYYLALARQLQGDHAKALEVIGPLVDQADQEGTSAEFADALLLQADSLLQTGKAAPAKAAIDRFQKLSGSKGSPRAWALLAKAAARSGDQTAAQEALDRLLKDFPTSPSAISTTLQLAEIAEDAKDWPLAERRYRQLEQMAAGTETEALAKRGVGWSLRQQQKFAAAASVYDQLVQKFPRHELVAEARYYHAESLREADQLLPAAKAHQQAFLAGKPKDPAPASAERQPPLLFVYRSGLQAARTLRQLKQVEAADIAYADVLAAFPRPEHLDRLLDEWALLNYEEQRYERADELFRRLVEEVPNSDLADNAQFSLAESDLLADRFDAAKQTFEKLLASEKSDAGVKERSLYQLVVLAMAQTRWSDVRTLGEQFLNQYSLSESRAYVNYCVCEALIGNLQASAADFEMAQKRLKETLAQVDPQPQPVGSDAWFPRLWILLAETQFRKKEYAEIEATAAALQQKLPKSPLLYQMDEIRGRALKQQAKFDEARAALQKVLAEPAAARTETAAKSQLLIAETYFLQEKWKEAFLAYQRVYASYDFPAWRAAALLQSGQCDEKLGQWREAVDSYTRLIDEFPESEHIAEAKRRLEAAKPRVK